MWTGVEGSWSGKGRKRRIPCFLLWGVYFQALLGPELGAVRCVYSQQQSTVEVGNPDACGQIGRGRGALAQLFWRSWDQKGECRWWAPDGHLGTPCTPPQCLIPRIEPGLSQAEPLALTLMEPSSHPPPHRELLEEEGCSPRRPLAFAGRG